MTRKIKDLMSVNLVNLTFSLDDESLKDQKDGIISVGVRYGVSNDLKKNEDGVLLANIMFTLVLGDDAIEATKENEKDIEIEGSGMFAEYELMFLSYDDLCEVDISLENEIFEITEPYVRENIKYLFSNSKHGVPPIPYRFWTKK